MEINFRNLIISASLITFQITTPLNVLASGFLDNDRAYLQRGRILYQSGQFDQAIRPFSEAIQANPNSADAYYWRALTFISLNQNDQALADLNSAIGVSSSVPGFFVSRGLLLENQKKFTEAIADFDAALRLDPYLQEAKTNKNYCASEITREHEIASKPVETAVVASSLTTKSSVVKSTARNAKNDKADKNTKNDEKALAALNARLDQEREERVKMERELAEVRGLEKQKSKEKPIEIASKSPSFVAAAQTVDATTEKKTTFETKIVKDMKPAEIATDAVAQETINRPVKDKWALIVGISKFENSDLNLHYPSKDADDFYNYLTTKGNFAKDHVKLLVDEKATRQNILTLLGDKWLPRVANPDDLVVIYISSHGSASEMDVQGVNYLLAYDSNVENLYSSGLAMQDLTRMIKARVHSDRVVMILDACHSGAATPESKGIERRSNVNAAEIAQGTGQLVISSSAPDQVSWESKKDANSVFTKYLMEGLASKGDKTTLEDAFQFMKDKVQEEVLLERGCLQTPVLRSKWKGSDLVLNARPSSPRDGLDINLGTPVEKVSPSTSKFVAPPAASASVKPKATPVSTNLSGGKFSAHKSATTKENK